MAVKAQVPVGYNFQWFEELDSTNAEAMRQAIEGEDGPLWIVAERQHQGRGRRGRKWIADSGNLFATLLFSWRGPVNVLSDLSFIAAVSCADTIKELIAGSSSKAEVQLKWPNDVLLDGAKTGGILIETNPVLSQQNSTRVVVGIGLNVVGHPGSEVIYPTTDLSAHEINTTAKLVFERLAIHFEHYFSQWKSGAGFNDIKKRWLDFGPSIGQEQHINTGSETITGIFCGIDERGGLIIRMSNGTERTFIAGEIVTAGINLPN